MQKPQAKIPFFHTEKKSEKPFFLAIYKQTCSSLFFSLFSPQNINVFTLINEYSIN